MCVWGSEEERKNVYRRGSSRHCGNACPSLTDRHTLNLCTSCLPSRLYTSLSTHFFLFSLHIKGIYIILELLVAFLAVNPCLFWALKYLLALARLVTEPVVWVAAGQTHSWKIQNNRIRTHMAEVGPPSFGDRLIKHTGTSYYPP